jgi:pyruvate dehydrogenase E1 component alpha subunit
MFGDGATNIGFFHEALNLSKVWQLPILWVCENNQYGMGTAVERASAVSEIRQKAEGYQIPNRRIDGMDILTVRKVAEEVLAEIRSNHGPYLLEIVTYRYRGHSMGDPERYRQADEVKKWQEQDPIGIYHRYLVDNNIASLDELENLDQQVESEVAAAVQFSESSPDPAPEALFEDIYVEN